MSRSPQSPQRAIAPRRARTIRRAHEPVDPGGDPPSACTDGGSVQRVIDLQTRAADVGQSRASILHEAAPQQSSNRRWCVGGQRAPVRILREHHRQRVRDFIAVKHATAGQHLEQHASERPDVGALVHRLPARLFGTHVRGGAENHAGLCHRRRRDGRRSREGARRRALLVSMALASPKSSTLTRPSGRTFTLAGLRSRWMIPCSCAASSASAICRAIGSASSIGIGPSSDPVGQRQHLRRVPSPAPWCAPARSMP